MPQDLTTIAVSCHINSLDERSSSQSTSRLAANMSPPNKRARWSFTFRSDEMDISNITTSREGHLVTYKDAAYRIIVGPMEQADDIVPYPHRHAMLHCQGLSVTASRAKEAIAVFLNQDKFVTSYFKPTDNPIVYMRYMFKEAHDEDPKRKSKKSVDEIIADAITASKAKKGYVDKAYIEELLASPGNYGASWVSRNRQVLAKALSIKTLCDARRVINFDLNEEENMLSTMRSVKFYSDNLKSQLKTNGFHTTHRAFDDWTKDQIRAYIMCITLIPNFVSRASQVDNLPGLYFWGKSDCGKSYMFNESVAYRKVATDAKGVSRFRQDGDQSAYLLDDWKNEDFLDNTNCSTIRQIALGSTARIKTFGDTEEIRGFVVATSNDIPFHLATDIPEGFSADCIQKHRAALARRFITVQFTDDLDVSCGYVTWLHQSSLLAQQRTINYYIQKIPEGPIKQKLQIYTDHIEEQYTYNELYDEMYSKLCDQLENSDE